MSERLETFANVARALRPEMQEAIDRMVERLKAHNAGETAPKPGELMPSFTLPDETGRLVSLDALLAAGPVAITFHRGHWCPYCRINTRALSEAQEKIKAEGAKIVAIMPDREQFAASFKLDADLHYPVLTDIDNGYALSLNLAIWVGAELEQLMAAARARSAALSGQRGLVSAHPGDVRSGKRRHRHAPASSIPTTAGA